MAPLGAGLPAAGGWLEAFVALGLVARTEDGWHEVEAITPLRG
jgi:hypothetical protein